MKNLIVQLISLFLLISCDIFETTGYLKEDDKVLFKKWDEGNGLRTKLLNADSNSFIDINGVWAKDKYNVFYLGENIPDLDSQSFVALDSKFGKDNRYVYCAFSKINEADAQSFRAVTDNISTNSYGKDKTSAYFCIDHLEGYRKIISSNINSFKRIGNGFYIDDNNVYWSTHKLIGVNPKSFTFLSNNGYYATDGKMVFYKYHEVIGADVETFKVIGIGRAIDKKYNYVYEKRGV